MNKDFLDYESHWFYSTKIPESYEFKIYLLEGTEETGHSSRTINYGYFSTKDKAINYLNNHQVVAQVTIKPIYVK